MLPTRALALCAAVLLLCSARDAASRDVKGCKLTVQAKKTGTLVKNVHCGWRCTSDPSVRCVDHNGDPRCPLGNNSGCGPERIILDQNAQLDLNGFDLVATYHGASPVVCAGDRKGKCRVKGPGMLDAGKVSTITVTDAQDIILENLSIAHDYYGIVTDGSVRVTGVTMDCDGGIIGRKSLRAKNVDTYGNCGLASDHNLYLDRVRIGGSGVWAGGTLRATDLTDGTVTGENVFLTRARNIGWVHSAGRVVLRDSEVGEIESGKKPRLMGSTCTQSRKTGTSESWGVCALD